jgi:hypothetical protein
LQQIGKGELGGIARKNANDLGGERSGIGHWGQRRRQENSYCHGKHF